MDITFLGTASAYPTPSRGVSSLIFRNEGTYWMFDCGEGTQIQLMKSPIKAGKISKIFISHLHGDHMFGLPGLMCTISQTFSPDNKTVLDVYGPQGLRRFLRTSLELSRAQLAYIYRVHELRPCREQYPQDWQEWPVSHVCEGPLHPNEEAGREITAGETGVWNLCEDERLQVKAAWLEHKIPSFGFVIQEKPTKGSLDANKLRELGIPPGPLYGKLKAGESITAPDGKTIQPADVVGPDRPGRKVAILGDTSKNSHEMALLCQGCSMLVHEATLEDELEESAIEKGHSTPGMAGRFAQSVEAAHLVLTHFSQRYKSLPAEPKEVKEGQTNEDVTVEKLISQAKTAFGKDSVTAAEDLLTVKVPPK